MVKAELLTNSHVYQLKIFDDRLFVCAHNGLYGIDEQLNVTARLFPHEVVSNIHQDRSGGYLGCDAKGHSEYD